MKYLVTGATGFIGRHLIPELLKNGHSVVAVARNVEKAKEFEWFGQVDFLVQDIHQPLRNPFRLFGSPDAMLHLAWTGLPNYSESFHYEENLPADYRFLKSLIDDGLKNLLVTGTCLEYGMQNGALKESLPTAPTNSYATAKDSLRKFLQLLQQQRPFNLQWARLFYLHGPGQNPNSLIGQLDRAISDGASVFNMSGGEQLRDYLPVQTVCSRLAWLAEHQHCQGVINICNGKPISVRNLVESHLKQRGAHLELNIGHYPYPDYEPMAFWGSSRFQNEMLESV